MLHPPRVPSPGGPSPSLRGRSQRKMLEMALERMLFQHEGRVPVSKASRVLVKPAKRGWRRRKHHQQRRGRNGKRKRGIGVSWVYLDHSFGPEAYDRRWSPNAAILGLFLARSTPYSILYLWKHQEFPKRIQESVNWLFSKTFFYEMLTLPHFLAPNETMPLRYFTSAKSLTPSYESRGPPESPEQESFPEK